MRIWISTEFLEIEDQREGKYNPEKLARIEQLLQLAEKYHIYLKFTLHHLRTISNSISPDASWCNSRSLSSKFKNVSEYVSSKKGKQSYLKRLKALAQKCQNHPVCIWLGAVERNGFSSTRSRVASFYRRDARQGEKNYVLISWLPKP